MHLQHYARCACASNFNLGLILRQHAKGGETAQGNALRPRSCSQSIRRRTCSQDSTAIDGTVAVARGLDLPHVAGHCGTVKTATLTYRFALVGSNDG